ncbi:putative RING-H2 finger protein ATL21A [Neltuma alba]|uniref:putative RING-H2 finger protein ATL21A n=1 Tax=Neltuma alba TaxID=207710 RepID=UPI0010A2B70E|nr:putative RING-H2 finger protein ATL21A [Prosopis alba]
MTPLLASLLLLLLLLIIPGATVAEEVEPCTSRSCGGIEIKFPFGLRGVNQSRRCSYPKFSVWCNNQSQTILTLPESGDLVINDIDYASQTLWVNDPGQCLPRRFLKGLNLSSASPCQLDPDLYNLINLTFLRCPSNLTQSLLTSVRCLNDPANSSFAVTYVWMRSIPPPWNESCEVINSSVPYPVSAIDPWSFWVDIGEDLQLTWGRPRCGLCESRGQDCGFAERMGLRTGCFSRSQESSGIPKGVKYGLTIGVGIPGVLCLIGLGCIICGKIRRRRNTRPSTDLPITAFAVQSSPFRMGLDGSTIEKYPMTLLGESRRLPKPNDNICSICLSEYEPKEALRTIPDCNHYFHAHCIDEWLRMNATCPVCRNSPTFTPSSASDSASSSVSPSSSISSSH